MNAKQIYLKCMYFTMCTALICILNIVKVGHNIGGNIISKLTWRPENRTAARDLSWPYSRIRAHLCPDSEYSDGLPI